MRGKREGEPLWRDNGGKNGVKAKPVMVGLQGGIRGDNR
jgi:hypothetical protein